MLVHQPQKFVKGVLLIASFAVVCIILLCPVLENQYGHHITALEYADDVFNSLSKGSSYFVPAVRESVEKVKGKEYEVNVALKAELAEGMVKLYQHLGAEASIREGRLIVKGDLGKVLSAATEVGDRLYFNDYKSIETEYHQPALLISRAFWYSLNPSIKDLQRQGRIDDAKVVDQVLRRALEPGNNFFNVEIVHVSDHVALILALLVIYILYTLWYGFGIMELFEGIGLSIHK